jgi:MYXO-CTERM domain-containing protein
VAFSPTEAGRFYAAVQVDSVTQSVDEGEVPNYYRDPDNFHRTIQLDGEALQGVGNVVLRPSAIDMGHHYKGERIERFGAIANTGDGDLTVEEPAVCRASDCANYSGPHDCVPCEVGQLPCDDAFTLDLAHFESGTLPGGASTLVGFVFEPLDLDGAICEVRVPTSDPDSPLVTFTVKGNVGFDPENIAPTVELHNPPVGYRHLSADDLVLDIDMFDPNQPADTLICKVRSLRNDAKVADCSPETASGHVFARIPVDLLQIGTDTLLVTVTDQSENRATASTTVLWGSYYPDSDDDGDGWGDDPADGDWVDCDDTDATVYPSAAELSDGKDNDCDGGVDERTVGGDDDGDSVSDIDGDCDDTDPATYPGAMELPDQKDNDCDGTVDENTSLSDDDGDGFAELDLDCNDRDGTVNPSAVELCDGIDNNCNSRVDEPGCQIVEFDPVIVGGITMTANAIGVGESTTMTVFVTDRDSEGLSFAWAEDSDLQSTGHTAISSPELQTITWTAPKELPEDSAGEVYSVNVIVQDEDGNQDWAFGEIWVYPESVETSLERVDLSAVDTEGCGGGNDDAAAAGAALMVPVLGALAAIRRRRRV